MQAGVEKTFWSFLGFNLLVTVNYVVNASWCVAAESWLEGHNWSTTSLIYLPTWLLFLLMGRKTRICDCAWISKEKLRDLRTSSFLCHQDWHVMVEEMVVGPGRREEMGEGVQLLGRRWIKVWVGDKREGCSWGKDSWSREDKDCGATGEGKTEVSWICSVVQR